MYRILFSCVCILSLCLIVQARQSEIKRLWRDSTGRFSVRAILQEHDDKTVKLKKIDGTSITLPLEKLSLPDQRYLESLSAKNPFEPENPFESGVTTEEDSDSKKNEKEQETKTAETQTIHDDKPRLTFIGQRVQDVNLRGTPVSNDDAAAWAGKPDPPPEREALKEPVKWTFTLENLPENTMIPKRTGFFVDESGKKALTAFHITARGGRDGGQEFTRIFYGNTETGQSISFDTAFQLHPLGFSPDGKRFAFIQEGWEFPPRGKKTLLHVANVDSDWTTGKTIEPFASFKKGRNTDDEADIETGTWADNDHFFVRSNRGALLLFNVNTGNAVWRMEPVLGERQNVVLSPGGKYCFVNDQKKTDLKETLTGKIVGSFPHSYKQRFSPSGKRFAMCSKAGFVLGDMTTGKLEPAFYIPGYENSEHFAWLDERLIFFNGGVVDTVTQSIIWNYSGAEVKFAGGNAWCYLQRRQPKGSTITIFGTTLPHAALKVPPATAKPVLVVQPGTKVSVVIDPSLAGEKEALMKSIEKKITANGWIIVPSAPISIMMKSTEGKEMTRSYSDPITSPGLGISVPIASGKNQVEVKYRPKTYQIAVMRGQAVLWSQMNGVSTPYSISAESIKGSSVQAAFDKHLAEQTFHRWVDMKTMQIPPQIAVRPVKKGTSVITENP